MKPFEVWAEGYLVTGMEGIPAKAQLLGTTTANSFEEACIAIVEDYEPNSKRSWACKLFDNEIDARKYWG